MTFMHRGYAGSAGPDEEGCFSGHIDGIKARVSFWGDDEADAARAFADAVEHYLASCEARGERPDPPRLSFGITGIIEAKPEETDP